MQRMPFVVLFASHRVVDAEAADRLARTLGRTRIEAQQWTINASPRVIGRVDSSADAERFVRTVREEGLDAEWVADDDVVATAKIPRPKAVRLLTHAIEADGELLVDTDVRALVRARLVTHNSRSSVEVERIQVGRETAVIARQKTDHDRVVEEALFVFGAHGERWLLVHNGLRYASLGVPLRPTQRDNFELLVALLRARVSPGRFDESLCVEKGSIGDAARAMDVLVHAVARRCGGRDTHPMR